MVYKVCTGAGQNILKCQYSQTSQSAELESSFAIQHDETGRMSVAYSYSGDVKQLVSRDVGDDKQTWRKNTDVHATGVKDQRTLSTVTILGHAIHPTEAKQCCHTWLCHVVESALKIMRRGPCADILQ